MAGAVAIWPILASPDFLQIPAVLRRGFIGLSDVARLVSTPMCFWAAAA
jgi:hypothetical protein